MKILLTVFALEHLILCTPLFLLCYGISGKNLELTIFDVVLKMLLPLASNKPFLNIENLKIDIFMSIHSFTERNKYLDAFFPQVPEELYSTRYVNLF